MGNPYKSDGNVITESHNEKGILALKAHWPHNSVIRFVSDDIKKWQKVNGHNVLMW